MEPGGHRPVRLADSAIASGVIGSVDSSGGLETTKVNIGAEDIGQRSLQDPVEGTRGGAAFSKSAKAHRRVKTNRYTRVRVSPGEMFNQGFESSGLFDINVCIPSELVLEAEFPFRRADKLVEPVRRGDGRS